MHPTKNTLPTKSRKKVITLLADRLADAIDLHSQAKEAHWNVKGPTFIALHELFDKVAGETEEYTDMLAERLVQLGGHAHGTICEAAKVSSLKQYPTKITAEQKHVEALSSAMAKFAGLCRDGIDTVDGQGDKVSADLLTEIARELDKLTWFVESHLAK
jgi:starvation-inducible DNA-binding protein